MIHTDPQVRLSPVSQQPAIKVHRDGKEEIIDSPKAAAAAMPAEKHYARCVAEVGRTGQLDLRGCDGIPLLKQLLSGFVNGPKPREVILPEWLVSVEEIATALRKIGAPLKMFAPTPLHPTLDLRGIGQLHVTLVPSATRQTPLQVLLSHPGNLQPKDVNGEIFKTGWVTKPPTTKPGWHTIVIPGNVIKGVPGNRRIERAFNAFFAKVEASLKGKARDLPHTRQVLHSIFIQTVTSCARTPGAASGGRPPEAGLEVDLKPIYLRANETWFSIPQVAREFCAAAKACAGQDITSVVLPGNATRSWQGVINLLSHTDKKTSVEASVPPGSHDEVDFSNLRLPPGKNASGVRLRFRDVETRSTNWTVRVHESCNVAHRGEPAANVTVVQVGQGGQDGHGRPVGAQQPQPADVSPPESKHEIPGDFAEVPYRPFSALEIDDKHAKPAGESMQDPESEQLFAQKCETGIQAARQAWNDVAVDVGRKWPWQRSKAEQRALDFDRVRTRKGSDRVFPGREHDPVSTAALKKVLGKNRAFVSAPLRAVIDQYLRLPEKTVLGKTVAGPDSVWILRLVGAELAHNATQGKQKQKTLPWTRHGAPQLGVPNAVERANEIAVGQDRAKRIAAGKPGKSSAPPQPALAQESYRELNDRLLYLNPDGKLNIDLAWAERQASDPDATEVQDAPGLAARVTRFMEPDRGHDFSSRQRQFKDLMRYLTSPVDVDERTCWNQLAQAWRAEDQYANARTLVIGALDTLRYRIVDGKVFKAPR